MVGNALAKKRSEEYLRQRENGFNLSGVHQERLPQYNALMDRNLRHHFESRPLQNHLNELGLIDQRGRIVDLDKQKSKLFIIDQEFKLAEDAERKKQREEEELRRRVQMKRHDALHNARQKEKLLQLKEEKRIAREIVQAAKGYNSVEPGQEDIDAEASTSAGETALSEMNAAFASCLSLVCPPIQYPPHCRFNPVRDAADTAEIEARLEEFFLHAKQLEQLFLNDTADSLSAMSLERSTEETDAEPAGRQQQSELELEILNLEAELAEKNDLIEKYTEVVRGWEGKFKRLDHRMSPDRE